MTQAKFGARPPDARTGKERRDAARMRRCATVAVAVAALVAIAPAQAETLDSLAETAAASIEPIDFGGGLAIRGAEARDGVLEINIETPPTLARDVDSLRGGMLSLACAAPGAQPLLEAGGRLALVFARDGAEPRRFEIGPEGCGVIRTDTSRIAADTATAGVIAQHGLEAAVAEVAASTPPGHMSDGLALTAVEAQGLRLVLTVASDSRGAAELAAYMRPVVCSEPRMRTLLNAGAEIDFGPASAAPGKPQAMTASDCR